MGFSSLWGWGVCLGQSHFKGGSGGVVCWVVGGLGQLKLAAAVYWTFWRVCVSGVKV